MKSAAPLTSGLAFAAPAFARIYGIAAPETVAAGSQVDITILTQNYIQSVQDIAIAFGLGAYEAGINESIGSAYLGSRYIGPDNSNILWNLTYAADIPSDFAHGPTILVGGLYSIYGEVHSPTFSELTVNITVGDETSSTIVSGHL